MSKDNMTTNEEPNMGVRGRILDENGKPMMGLVVVAEGEGKTEASIMNSKLVKLADKVSPVSLIPDHELGKSRTDKDGFYRITYSTNSYKTIIDEKPNIWLVVRDMLDVAELYKTDKFSAVSEPIKKVEDIHINRNWANGWFITLGGTDKSRFTSDNDFEILIDNEKELKCIVKSINNAKSYVYLSQIEFDPDFVATFNSDDDLSPKDVLVDVLKNADERGVNVKIILNENLALPDSLKKIKDKFKSTGVEVRGFKSSGLHVMHAKTLIVDGYEAFVIGSAFIPDYWDTSMHLINDPRREPELVRPVHDISVKLNGGSVYYVEELFVEMWNYISSKDYNGKNKLNISFHPISSGEDHIQIARSVTKDTLTKKGELGIFEGYRKAIAQASDFIYLENQYFTNNSILKALKNVIKFNDDLQVIFLINEDPELPGYKKWQNKAIKKLGIKNTEDNLKHPQIGFFSLWSSGWGENQYEIQPIYVHTKAAVVDDIWATVGTANLDGTSLTHVNELKGFFDSKFHRSMEINVMILDDKSSKNAIESFRNSLWNEHLGYGKTSLNQPINGWLELWQKTAQDNIRSLNQKKPYINGQILPYSPEKSVKDQLDDININTEDWNVLDLR